MESHRAQPTVTADASSSNQQNNNNTLTEEAVVNFLQFITNLTIAEDPTSTAGAKASIAQLVRKHYLSYATQILRDEKKTDFERQRNSLTTRITSLYNDQPFQEIVSDLVSSGELLKKLFNDADEEEKQDFLSRLSDLSPIQRAQVNLLPAVRQMVSGQTQEDKDEEKLSPLERVQLAYQAAFKSIHERVNEGDYQAAVKAADKSLAVVYPIYQGLSKENQRILMEDNIMSLASILDIHADEFIDKANAAETSIEEKEKLLQEALQCKCDALNFADFVYKNKFVNSFVVAQYAANVATLLAQFGDFYFETKKDFEAAAIKFEESIQVLQATPDNDLFNAKKTPATLQYKIAASHYAHGIELQNYNYLEAMEKFKKAISFFKTRNDCLTELLKSEIGLAKAKRGQAAMLLTEGKHAETIAELKQAVTICESMLDKTELTACLVDLAKTHHQYGKWLLQDHKYPEATNHLCRAISLFEKLQAPAEELLIYQKDLAATLAPVVEEFKASSTAQCSEGRFKEAVDTGQEALKIVLPASRKLVEADRMSLLPNYIMELASKLGQQANVILEQSRVADTKAKRETLWQAAIDQKSEALEFVRALLQNQLIAENAFVQLAENTATILLDFAKYYLAAGNYKAAIEKFAEYRGLLESIPAEVIQEKKNRLAEANAMLSMAWNRYGRASADAAKYDEAIFQFTQAVTVLESAPNKAEDLLSYKNDLASLEQWLKDELEKKMLAERQLIKQLKQMVAELKTVPDEKQKRRQYQMELAEVEHQHALSWITKGNELAATQQFQAAIENFSEALSVDPSGNLKAKLFACKIDLACTLSRIADANFKSGLLIEALDNYATVIKALFPSLAQKHEKVQEAQCLDLLNNAKEMFEFVRNAYWKQRKMHVKPISSGNQLDAALIAIKKFDGFSQALPFLAPNELQLFGHTAKKYHQYSDYLQDVQTKANARSEAKASSEAKARSEAKAAALAEERAIIARAKAEAKTKKSGDKFQLLTTDAASSSSHDTSSSVNQSEAISPRRRPG
jgi:tetratricopeptide (TPR) repeat protein